ncbi:hypothetical protein BC004224 [Homo sapiens]|uniref:Putative uncharacterized protein SHANK2-AS3 n=1 Tax=Homo sapiens TaxID=9606 RepID=SHAS3_HUMAN|nr:RecName: Full=Putative uncharacterized protein SHANK2-AS3 [Homo sapiens]EAW74783.1 hypothetical protein BC004224 [Homo sapiens]
MAQLPSAQMPAPRTQPDLILVHPVLALSGRAPSILCSVPWDACELLATAMWWKTRILWGVFLISRTRPPAPMQILILTLDPSEGEVCCKKRKPGQTGRNRVRMTTATCKPGGEASGETSPGTP